MNQIAVKQLVAKYLENEGENFHCENLVLLAENFGTSEDVARAKKALDDRNNAISSVNGNYTFQCYLWNRISPEFRELYENSPGGDDED